MGTFSELKTKDRDGVAEPKGTELFKGMAWMAAGIICVSFILTDVSTMWKAIFVVPGIIFLGIGCKCIIKYIKTYMAFKKYVPHWDSDRDMYDRFAIEFNEWQQEGKAPTCCDGDTLYYLKLQRARLKKKGLKMTNRVMPAKGTSYGTANFSRKSSWYTTDMEYEEINRSIRFENGQGTVYERKVDQVMYEIIVHTPNEDQLSNIMMTCPNCGAVSRVSELEEGCKYCETKFRITDLFPRVVNVFFLKNLSTGTSKNIVRRTILFSMLTIYAAGITLLIISGSGFLPAKLFDCFFAAILAGGPFGLILAELRLVVSLFDRDGMKHFSYSKCIKSKRKITDIMKKFDSDFEFDKFESQIVALIRMAVFAEQPEGLACYRGGNRDERLDDILEMTYTKALCLRHVRTEGKILHLTIRTWWVNYSEIRGKVQKTGDCIDVEISRNTAAMEPPGFSITSVSCPNCGGSFDAVRQKFCPYCDGEYHMEDKGWVIDDMCLIR